MANEGIDPGLLQDFLTESGELIEQLDGDLVRLERAGADECADLLNQIFRALHTIKGAASFLQMTVVTTFAHAAEDALNRLRKGDVQITPEIMDALLRSVDIVRGMLAQVADAQPVTPGPAELVDRLHAIADGAATASAHQPAAQPSSQPAAAPVAAVSTDGPAQEALPLGSEKLDLLDFMVTDLRESAQHLERCVAQSAAIAGRSDAADHLAEITDAMGKTAEFFGLTRLHKVFSAVNEKSRGLADVSDAFMPEAAVRLLALAELVRRQADALADKKQILWPLETFTERLTALFDGKPIDTGDHGGDITQLLAIDGVIAAAPAAAPVAAEAAAAQPAASPAAGAPASPEDEHSTDDAARAAGKPVPGNTAARNNVGEQTLRVEVARLEALLNLVGQLVLSKNRFLGLSRKLREYDLSTELNEELNGAASELDRLTSELQVGVMRTRMQPLAKLFERYPRVIRDIARATGKNIDLAVKGKETEVDKSVLELLGDPLIHMLRNSADHGIESPEKRTASGKPANGTIVLSAEHQGSHVRVVISDDGKGLDRDVLGKKAIEKGIATPEQVAGMSDQQVFQFIFAAGFSTAEKVTDLSGRGVGMDVVRTNIAKLNGTINLSSVKGRGTTVEILIPLTVAIMPAMVVGVGKNLYAVPLTSIIEIVRPEDKTLHSVRGRPVMTLRESVLPLIDMHERLGETRAADNTSRFAVVVGVGQDRAGLIVDRLIGQQEVVIKPLDDTYTAGGPFSGATIREDGDVSLILDIIQLIRTAQAHSLAA